jgi:diaminohydroxyphosphoribosylaminopyrimidine deaminase / 5-amino-6-(5-phosphoribosylamino)uracil reductase
MKGRDMASQLEIAAMRRALELASSPDAPLGPNPRVGCVLLGQDGHTIAEGYHRGAGSAHAEIVALHRAATTAGATAVVTLEPCDHTGRTAPCSLALIAGGVQRVVYAQSDTSPIARGGAERLRSANIDVESGVLEQQARDLNHTWTFAVEHGRPFVTWKFAASLDGRSSAADGSSRWITSEPARADVHRLRAETDAILVGTGTALADDPRLTVRHDGHRPREQQPLRAVMGMRDLPTTLRVLDEAAETLHLRTRDVTKALAALFEQDRQHVWLEGGPTIAGAFWRARRVDRVVAYLAPSLLGNGAASLIDAGVATVSDAIRLEIDDVSRVGPDLRIMAHPQSLQQAQRPRERD